MPTYDASGTTGGAGNLNLTKLARYITAVDAIEIASTPAAARIYIRDGNGGPVKIPINLAAGGSVGRTFTPPIYCPSGAFVEIMAGTVRYAVTGY